MNVELLQWYDGNDVESGVKQSNLLVWWRGYELVTYFSNDCILDFFIMRIYLFLDDNIFNQEYF